MGRRRENGLKGRQLNAISLFTGAMGLDLGLEKAGFKVRVAVECDPVAVQTIKKNRPKLKVIPHPIEHVPAKRILKDAGLRAGKVDLVIGGPCCQPFSTAGNRKSVKDDEGGRLFNSYIRIIRDIRPRFFVMENVPGILSAARKHRPLIERGPGHPKLQPEERLGSAFRLMLRELRRLGYYILWGVLNSADFGVPQARRRVIFIGSRDGEDISLPGATHFKDGKGTKRWVPIKKVLKGVRSKRSQIGRIPPKWLKYVKIVPEGGNWQDLPKSIRRFAMGGALKSWGGRNGFFRRLSWNEPSPSLTTRPTSKATLLCHPEKDRPLSTPEYARIQQFPDGWEFAGSLSQQYRQIGNAVPVGLGAAIGRQLRKLFLATPKRHPSRRKTIRCADPELERRLRERPATILNPPRMRRYEGVEAFRKWMKLSKGRSRAVVLGKYVSGTNGCGLNGKIRLPLKAKSPRLKTARARPAH